MYLTGTISQKEQVIDQLNQKLQEQEVTIDSLQHQKEEANLEIAHIMEAMSHKQSYFEAQIADLEEELQRTRSEHTKTQETLNRVKSEF